MQLVHLEGDPGKHWEGTRNQEKGKEGSLSIKDASWSELPLWAAGTQTLEASVRAALQLAHLRTRELGYLYINFHQLLVRGSWQVVEL